MPKTYNELYIGLRNRLREAGVEACAQEARYLLAYAADKRQEALLRDLQLYTSPEVEERLEWLARRRLAGEPVAYITGSWEFYGLPLTVSGAVLIPRSDTEALVDKALELVGDRSAQTRILDLCTGSGCIACALGVHLPHSRLVMADLSLSALNVARQNARDSGLGARAVAMELNALNPPPANLGSFDLIVSNPPYVPKGEIETLDVSVRDHEPRMALDGGEDGLDFYRAILRHWKGLLRPGGWLVVEVGETQAEAVAQLMRFAGLRSIGFAQDAGGRLRVVCGRL